MTLANPAPKAVVNTALTTRSGVFKPDAQYIANTNDTPIDPSAMGWNPNPVILGGVHRNHATGSVRKDPNCIFRVGTKYGMIYSAPDPSNSGLQFTANLCWSDDLINWVECKDNPILDSVALSYQSSRVWIQAIVLDDSPSEVGKRWVAVVGGNGIDVSWGVRASHVFYSADLKTWTAADYTDGPIFNALNTEYQSWGPEDTDRLYVTGLVKTNGKWYAFVQVGVNNGPYLEGLVEATSPEGPWTVVAGATPLVTLPAWCSDGAEVGQPVFADGKWWRAFHDIDTRQQFGLMSATRITGPWSASASPILDTSDGTGIAVSGGPILIPQSDHWAMVCGDRPDEGAEAVFGGEKYGALLFQSGVDPTLFPIGNVAKGPPSGSKYTSFAFGSRFNAGMPIDWGEQNAYRYLLLAKVGASNQAIMGHIRGRGASNSARAASALDMYVVVSTAERGNGLTDTNGINWTILCADGYQSGNIRVVVLTYNEDGRTDGAEVWYAVDFGSDSPRMLQHGWFDGHTTEEPNQWNFVATTYVSAVAQARAKRPFLWTPTLEGSASNPTTTLVARGTWRKDNELVTAFFDITVTAISGGSGNLRIGGLPVLRPQLDGFSDVNFSTLTGITLPGTPLFPTGRVYNISGTPKIHFPIVQVGGTESLCAVSSVANGARISGKAQWVAQYA